MTAELAALITAGVAVVGAAAALIKGRAESRHIAVQAAHEALDMLRATYDDKVTGLQSELDEQKSRRLDLQDKVTALEYRISRLEGWIIANTDTHPADINGEDEPEGIPV